MIKIITLVGTRPEIIKLSAVIKELDKYTNHILVHSGQNYDYELNEVFFNDLGLRKPDYFLEASGTDATNTIANVIVKSDEVFLKEKPDALLLYGDTNSCLAVISAKKRQIPIFHMEAGNRCFDQRVPEEINRKIVDHLSDINMPLSEHARKYLEKEGINPETIIKTGSPMYEVLSKNMKQIDNSNILDKENLKRDDYFIVSIHREENVDYKENFDNLLETLNAIASHYKKRILISTHPRTRKKLEEIKYNSNNSLLVFSKPYGFHDYIKLQKNAFCVISDSGTITEEASILNLPAITVRQAHERPEGMDEGALIMSGLKKGRVLECINVIREQHNNKNRTISIVRDYEINNVSKKVLRIILSYTDYINRTVWKKKT